MSQVMNQIVHVRYNGRSDELQLAALDLPGNANDAQIKQAVANYLDLALHALDHYVVVRTSSAIIVRPEAIYG